MTIINLTADNIRKAKARRLIACPIVTVLTIAAMAPPAFAEPLKDKVVGTWIYVLRLSRCCRISRAGCHG